MEARGGGEELSPQDRMIRVSRSEGKVGTWRRSTSEVIKPEASPFGRPPPTPPPSWL